MLNHTLIQQRPFAFGQLGKYYENKQRYQEALEFTKKARSQGTNPPDETMYKWDWQAARIYKNLGLKESAMQAYSSAIASLQRIRRDRGTAYLEQIDFELEIEPIHRELIELLLSGNPSRETIKKAIATRDLWQLSELENYFGEICLELDSESEFKPDENTGLIYTLVFREETYLILRLANDFIKSFKLDASSQEIEALAQQWRLDLESREHDDYLFSGKQIYDYLIKVIEPDLAQKSVSNLMFINDGYLRNVPMSALHDGQKFLVEDYDLSVSLGLNLKTKPREPLSTKSNILAFGLSESRNSLPPLPFVEKEIESISQHGRVKSFLNSEFTAEQVEGELLKNNYPSIHFATHGYFGETLSSSYLKTYQGQVNLTDLERILYQHRNKFPQDPVNLLVLSACETAAGSKRAILGLAEVAIRSGVTNAVGSLWSVNDRLEVEIVDKFYEGLLRDGYEPFSALAQAQRQMIEEGDFHPAIWSNLVLVDNF